MKVKKICIKALCASLCLFFFSCASTPEKKIDSAYVMVYDKEHCDPVYKRLQRWVNMRSVFAKIDRFEDYQKAEAKEEDNEVALF